MKAVDDAIARACVLVPSLVRCALVLLPEGLLIGGIGADSVLDHEPLIRSAMRCLTVRATPAIGDGPPARFVEYLFVIDDQLVVIQGGRGNTRLALAVVCTREPNLALVLNATRRAVSIIEESLDLRAWEA
jgi:hypothetical protein